MRKLWTLVAILVAVSFIGLNVASAEDAPAKKGDRKHPPGARKHPPIKKIFKRLDANSDGSLSAEELEKSPRIDGEAKAKEILAKWDKNKDGTVCIKEFSAALKRRIHAKHGGYHKGDHRKAGPPRGDRKPPPIEEIFKKLETNSDGSLSAEEILAPLDENKDGTVCIKEFAAAMKKIHAKHGIHRKGGHPRGEHHKKGDHKKREKKECPSKE